MDYKEAGVDVAAGRSFVEKIRQDVQSTQRSEVLGQLGGFAGCFQLPSGYREPVLVSGTDGVGTKLKIAHSVNQHHTVGIDLVAMCVNDILTTGAEPLFFLDYIATGKLEPEQLAEVVAGIAEGCRHSGCALLGGETAEMPGFYGAGEYDLAGFCVGVVEKADRLDGSQVQVGDVAIALPSNGIHSNGFSLVRKIIATQGYDWADCPAGLGGASLLDTVLAPTQIYVNVIRTALAAGLDIHGMAHITGGGLPENLPRCLNSGQSIRVDRTAWTVPPVFQWLAQAGDVSEAAMFDTFNMGVGYGVIVPVSEAEGAIAHFTTQGMEAIAIGEVIPGDGSLEWAA
ncbi:phosphoribosylformylglycinamidine cyclo-ligase [Spirulina major CS-329]|uniref:phosphoribosylformylglycinamidine cyclo-ligase n=1 Tax=Spirulina TaxID=1154 RepID=UPI00232BD18B|nr:MULTISPECIES: phosphoribosylformylglycinamidine cyclo-ligase [Spirulina]MDB9493064.1 phosphoribosylformylglycinamidine cyclo-ligase [Spirulina subsalsa CS-330]MDB9503575.1 phosphoribosylformylglycinamidine cyclo-ligase [Spirulina major CS-329]